MPSSLTLHYIVQLVSEFSFSTFKTCLHLMKGSWWHPSGLNTYKDWFQVSRERHTYLHLSMFWWRLSGSHFLSQNQPTGRPTPSSPADFNIWEESAERHSWGLFIVHVPVVLWSLCTAPVSRPGWSGVCVELSGEEKELKYRISSFKQNSLYCVCEWKPMELVIMNDLHLCLSGCTVNTQRSCDSAGFLTK